ncbi:o-succinylbenzoate synthase [Dermabacteraceae bacterium P7054]
MTSSAPVPPPLALSLPVPAPLRERGISRAVAFSIPMTLRFRGITRREGVLLHGISGWGEFSPFSEYGTAESANWLRCAVEAATCDYPEMRRGEVGVNVTVPVVAPEHAHRIVSESGARTAKVKVADARSSLPEDAERLRAVRDALGPQGKIRVDANAAWDVAEASAALEVLEQAAGGLEYAEQPCPSLEELAELRRRIAVPIAADESIRRAGDPERAIAMEAADVVVVKVQPLGGVRRCLALAAASPVRVVVSSALETSIGLYTGYRLAAALESLDLDCGLGTASLLGADVLAEPLRPTAGSLAVPQVRPVAEARAVAAVAADETTARAWQERLALCAELID